MIFLYILLALTGLFLIIQAIRWGYRWQYWRLPRTGLLTLMYHHIAPQPIDIGQTAFTISPQRFEEQIAQLRQHGFTPITLRDIDQARHSKMAKPQKPVLFTFDDGYANNFTHLFPLLQKHRIPAIIFLITDLIGKDPLYITWDQARQMQQSGLVEFGSHTASHARLRQLSDEEILKELQESKKKIERELGVACRAFCYPFGSGGFDKRVRPLIFQAGYEFDFSTKQGINAWPWLGKKTILRTFPRGGETMRDFYIQITRGKSRF
ncbi:MAG: polysaccharide deacetylase family protein [Elusimicrobiaceae bacterium]|nr:polysaccharide deacetylase family protein [Elusimicrobiaceae bacterium]